MGEDREEKPRTKRAVEGMGELSTSVCVSKDDTSKCQCERETLWRWRLSEGGRDGEGGENETCRGTCQRLRVRPNTKPMGNRTPQTRAWRPIWRKRIASMGAWSCSSDTSSWCVWAYAAGMATRRSGSGDWILVAIIINVDGEDRRRPTGHADKYALSHVIGVKYLPPNRCRTCNQVA